MARRRACAYEPDGASRRRRPLRVVFAYLVISTRARNLVALAVVVGGAALGGALLVAPARGRRALDAVPAEAFVVVSVDAKAARESALAETVRTGAAAGVPLLGRVSEACGWDVLGRVEELVVALPEENAGAFGIAAKTDVEPAEVKACADRMIGDRGGKARLTTRGRFHVLEDEGKADGAAIAYGEGGVLVVGSGPWFDAMLDAAEGKRPAVGRAGEHAALRGAVTGARPALATATALLPEATRARVKKEMNLEGSKDDLVMAAVLAVRAAGASVALGKKEEGAELRLELRCETEAACADVKALLERKRLAWSQDLRLRLLGAGPLVDSLTVEARGATATAKASIAAEDLGRLLERMRSITGARESSPMAAPPGPRPAATPSETIRAPGGRETAPSGTPREHP